MDTNPYDCRKCGACCGFFCTKPERGRATVHTPLTDRDVERMPLRLRKRLVQIETVGRMTLGGGGVNCLKTELRLAAVTSPQGNVCEHFRGEIGGEGCGCAIYRHRPFNCRYFANDQDHVACRMARSAYGFEPKVPWLNSWEVSAATDAQLKTLEPYILPDPAKHMHMNRKRHDFEELEDGVAYPKDELTNASFGMKG